MAVRCKFTLQSVTTARNQVWNQDEKKSEIKPVQSFKFYVVNGTDGENGKFFASTPTGSIEVGIVNPEAATMFELGKSYYVTFTPAD